MLANRHNGVVSHVRPTYTAEAAHGIILRAVAALSSSSRRGDELAGSKLAHALSDLLGVVLVTDPEHVMAEETA